MINCIHCGRFLSKDEEEDCEDMASDFQEQDVIYCCDKCMKQGEKCD